MKHFLQMGGYATYVWGSYGIAMLMFVANGWWTRKRDRQIQRAVTRWWQA